MDSTSVKNGIKTISFLHGVSNSGHCLLYVTQWRTLIVFRIVPDRGFSTTIEFEIRKPLLVQSNPKLQRILMRMIPNKKSGIAQYMRYSDFTSVTSVL